MHESRVEFKLPVLVKLIRLAPRKLDSDNLQSALKYIRDAVADRLIPGLRPGMADDDERIKWEYGQEKGAYGVKIEIEEYL